jgi:hypothetical protein
MTVANAFRLFACGIRAQEHRNPLMSTGFRAADTDAARARRADYPENEILAIS